MSQISSGVRIIAFFAAALVAITSTTALRHGYTSSIGPQRRLLEPSHVNRKVMPNFAFVVSIRGGTEESGNDDDEEYEQVDLDEEEEIEVEYDEYDEYDEDDGEGVATESLNTVPLPEPKYVEPYFMSPFHSIMSTILVLNLSQRIDFFDPFVVKVIRALFILKIIITELLIGFVQIMAKKRNNRTPVQLENPLSDIVKSLLGDSGSSGMVKNLASSFLSSKTTIMEYDMKQAINMQGAVLIELLIMWIMHFKMNRIQPLVMTTVNSFVALLFSPLFQVYVLGRNLERPFKSPVSAMPAKPVETDEEDEEKGEESVEKTTVESTVEVTTKVEIVDDEEEEDNDDVDYEDDEEEENDEE